MYIIQNRNGTTLLQNLQQLKNDIDFGCHVGSSNKDPVLGACTKSLVRSGSPGVRDLKPERNQTKDFQYEPVPLAAIVKLCQRLLCIICKQDNRDRS